LEARQLEYDIREKRHQFSIGFLVALDCPDLISKLNGMSSETDCELHLSRNVPPTRLLRSPQLSGIELLRRDKGLVERSLRNIKASKNWRWVNDFRKLSWFKRNPPGSKPQQTIGIMVLL
jgi:hypothetical protein